MISEDSEAASVFLLDDATALAPLASSRYLNSLSIKEKQRLAKMKSAKRRLQFVISRFLLIELIYQQLGVRISIETSLTGQPFIKGCPVFCSISHSGNSIAVGFSTYGAIGVDIEQHRQRRIGELVRHYFHQHEIDDFNSISENQRLLWFYRQWTIKEAMAKATGEGINFHHLSRKINKIDANIFISVKNEREYSLACVHHSNHPLKFNTITFQNNSLRIRVDSLMCQYNP